jgi:hypothetical protein
MFLQTQLNKAPACGERLDMVWSIDGRTAFSESSPDELRQRDRLRYLFAKRTALISTLSLRLICPSIKPRRL